MVWCFARVRLVRALGTGTCVVAMDGVLCFDEEKKPKEHVLETSRNVYKHKERLQWIA